MIPNTQFQINPAAQQGTGQQVNGWVDHTAQQMPQFQGGPQIMQPLGAVNGVAPGQMPLQSGGPVAQPLAQPGQPTPMPPTPAPMGGQPQMGVGPDGHPISVASQHPAQQGGRAYGSFYDPSLPDHGMANYQNAFNAWQAGKPGGPGTTGDLTHGMDSEARRQAHIDFRNSQSAYMSTRPQWFLPPGQRGVERDKPQTQANPWPGGGGYSG